MTFAGHTAGTAVPAQHPDAHAADTAVETVTTAVTTAVELRARSKRRYFDARPVLRRVVYVVGYETLSVLFTVVVLSALLGHGGGESTLTAILVSTTATLWNYVWNTAFEAVERRVGARGRGAASRAVHAVGYEGGVLVFTIPLVAFMLGIGLLEAFAIEGGLLVFFLVFTLAYTWAFDRLFGLPASARAAEDDA